MKKKFLFVLITLIGIVIAYVTYSHIGIEDTFKAFGNFSLGTFLVYLFAVILIETFLLLRWKLILNAHDLSVPLHTLFFYKMSGYAVGYLSPQPHAGGEPIRAILLKRNGISFKQGISTVLIDKSMQLLTDFSLASFGIVLVLLHISLSAQIMFFIIFILSTVAGLLLLFFYRMMTDKPFLSSLFNIGFLKKHPRIQKLRQDIMDIEDIIHAFYVHHMEVFLITIGINLLLWCLMIVEYGSMMILFGFEPDLLSIFIIMGGVALSYSFPVPMALGVLELSQIGALGFLRIDKAIGLSISLLIRLKDILRSAIGVLALIYYGVSWKLVAEEIQDARDIPKEKIGHTKKA